MTEKKEPYFRLIDTRLIVHFEYLTPCPQCGSRWSGMYKVGEDSYLCIDCFEKEHVEVKEGA